MEALDGVVETILATAAETPSTRTLPTTRFARGGRGRAALMPRLKRTGSKSDVSGDVSKRRCVIAVRSNAIYR